MATSQFTTYILLGIVAGMAILGWVLPGKTAQYTMNFVTFNSHPNCTNCVNFPAATNCTGVTSNGLTMKATESVLITGQYVFNDLNTTMTGPIGVQIGRSTAVPATTFGVAPCATSLGVIAQFLALPFQSANFQVSWSFTLTLTAGLTYYFWVDISMNNAFTGHIKFTQTGAVDFIQAVELR